MDYKQLASELIEYLIMKEQRGRMIHKKLSEVAKGEIAVLIFLLQENKDVNAYEISQHFEVNTSRVAAILNSLCKKGYIIRNVDEQDKRKVKVIITEQGREFCMERYNETVLHLSELLEKLGADDTIEYIRMTKKIAMIVEDMKKEEK